MPNERRVSAQLYDMPGPVTPPAGPRSYSEEAVRERETELSLIFDMAE